MIFASQRRREFDIDKFCPLAAQSVGRSSQDIDTFVKFTEGGFEIVAHIPYPVTVPKFYVIASGVVTVRFLRSSGLPVPEVYDYTPSSDNAVKSECIFMNFMKGTKLSDVWLRLEESDIVLVLHQLAQLESRMMSIPFPAGGSLYYTNDLVKVAGSTGIPFNDERFCVGPDARLYMWYGKRSQLDVDRGPCLPLFAFSFVELPRTNRHYRRKRRGSARSSSSQGTSVSGTVRSTATTIPA